MATMEDIAKKLGVTKGTVSKAMSGAPDVSEAMRSAILETAVELGYSRVVRNGEAKRICVFVENMAWEKPEDFGWELITGFRKLAEPAGFSVDIIPLNVAMEKAESYDAYMMRRSYLGAFFLGLTFSDPWMRDFRACRTPAILYDNRVKYNPSVTTVGMDSEEGMELAVSALKKLGHTRIGYLSSALGSYIYQVRYMAYFHALRQNGLKVERSLTGKSLYISECLESHFPRLRNHGCTAIICSHDLLAHSVILHCGELGIRIPEDLSIIGFDDIPLCRYTAPSLSSVRQNREEIGRSAFYALLSQLGNISINELLLHAELMQRGSIGRAPT